ncbi:MAG TPA: nuclear transport factor 2 family protein [Solirubrobacteraceae bacterium]|jgi:ketosteroid isomerase-like protein
MSSAKVFRDYLDRFTAGDAIGAADLLTDDFSFHGPILQSEGKEAFLEGAQGLGPVVRGNEMLRQWEDGEEVCSVYEFKVKTPVGEGSIPMTEWSRIRDGKIASSRLIFDTAQLAALMPQN